jgi:hypothetical protein
MRKSSLAKLALTALFVIPTAYIFAATGTSTIRVTVKSVDKLTVTNGGTITLDGTAGSNALSGTDNTTAVLNYTHNKNVNKKITASATTSPAAAGNDITLTVAVQDGAGAKTVYDDAGAASAQDVVTGLAAGAIGGKTVTYSASCTASGTEIAADTDFDFTITFTSVDE